MKKRKGDHYNKNPSGVECIDIVKHFNFCLGNAIKYIWRAGIKTDDSISDLKKAIDNINFEIDRIENLELKDDIALRGTGSCFKCDLSISNNKFYCDGVQYKIVANCTRVSN